jgi:hypothetical protein
MPVHDGNHASPCLWIKVSTGTEGAALPRNNQYPLTGLLEIDKDVPKGKKPLKRYGVPAFRAIDCQPSDLSLISAAQPGHFGDGRQPRRPVTVSDMGFNPFRPQDISVLDIVMVVFAVGTALALIAWALFST